MKKRAVAIILLTSLIITTFSSCKRVVDGLSSDFSFIDEIIEIKEETKKEIEYKVGNSLENITDNSERTTEKMPTLQGRVELDVAQTVSTDEEIIEPTVSVSLNEVEFRANTAVLESEYYQYSTLSGDEKTLYSRMADTISKSKYIIDINDLSINEDQVLTVFQKVLADYPQYFYVSKSCMVAYGTKKSKIRAVALRYTDGNTTDEFDKRMRLVNAADRNLINQKIELVNSKIEPVVSGIDGNMKDVLKEKIIHDYVAKTVTYDSTTAANIKNLGTTLPHSFDIYGAIVENRAVCEGYSKLFQYLCYLVGINSNQATGTADGGNHMWNTVLIDGKWYQVDVTWDDGDEFTGYNYFNLTTDSIGKDHIIDLSDISAPLCNADTNSFDSVFALIVNDGGKEPENYENAIENMKAIGDKVIYVKFGERISGYPSQVSYIKRHILRQNGTFGRYLKNSGVTLRDSVNQIGKYYIIKTDY